MNDHYKQPSAAAQVLRRVINPAAVAVIGASGDQAKFGGRVMKFLVKHGYPGRIVPVNPHPGTILGIEAVRRIADSAHPVDVALLALPAAHLPAALEDCGAARVPCCVVMTADFAELGDEGAAREAELVRIARRHDMRLIGPNCLGFINPGMKLALTSSMALAIEPLPRGEIGLISQSGSMMASMLSRAADVGAGFSACVTVGNQADLEICDFIEYFIEDEATRAILVYVEGLKDGQRFVELATRCREARKPLLAVKAGASDAGSRIARSHTASIAGSHAVWEAVCRESGVIAVDDPESLVDCAHFLVRFGGARAPGVAALSPSGGTIAVTADRIAAAGLELAALAPETQSALRRIVPASRPLNPLDVGGLARDVGVSATLAAQTALSDDANVGVVLIVVATTPQLDEKVRSWGEAAIASGKPTAILFTPGSIVDSARASLRELGCPYTDRMDDALRVVRAALDYGRILKPGPQKLDAPDYIAAVEACVPSLPHGQLTEAEAKALLRSAGIPTTPEILAADPEAALTAASRFGFPVVLKAVSRELVHKSDVGAVKLGLNDAAAVRRAWHEIAGNVSRHLPDARFEGCLVQPMVTGGVEVILGARWDAQFGAMVMAGAGGIFVETMKDTALALAPLDTARALMLLRSLKVWPLLDGARGSARVDADALAEALVRLSWLAASLGRRLVELDINPVLVQTTGVVALDARATLAGNDRTVGRHSPPYGSLTRRL